MGEGAVPYSALSGFEHLYLEDSFVLTEGHPRYSKPRQGEYYCFQRGVIEFANVHRLLWRAHGTPPSADASGTVDHGNIDSMRTAGRTGYLEGDWGQLGVDSDAPTVRFDEDSRR